MKFWISGEVMADVGDSFREAMNEVEDELNERFAERDYGRALQELTFIAIILPPAEDAYPEIYKYDKRGRAVEARLKVTHHDFLNAPSKEDRKRLLLDGIENAISRMGELKIAADHQRLHSDFRNLRSA